MGMYNSFRGELVCSCGEVYKGYTPTMEQARKHAADYREMINKDAPNTGLESMRTWWAKMDGYETFEEWRDYINSDKYLEELRKQRHWGLVEVQDKSIGFPVCEDFYVGDSVPDAPIGHLAVQGWLICRNKDCKQKEAWVEIMDQKFVGLSIEVPKLHKGE